MKSSETDITFLNRLNARNHEAFQLLFREYFQDIAYYAGKILKDMDVAEDIAQDIFVRLWEKNNHFENYLALKSYLYLSARNSCLNYIKHHNIVLEHAQTQKTKETEENTWNTIVETEIISLLSDYIRQLPAECAKIMELVMQGYNSTEISTLTGASSSTVRSQKQRGIALLKKIVSPELYALFILFMQQTH
ncbi:sigma-70 family RNA polymerase sigma factor [Butyricimonas hominis]|jgi:RNA polymerase sigma factor, sigma-70 family|uniref:Sigma-70 family RNA polymerase sigma factor n=1 Tax=Butyricimonas hominis TaxID=2763032 RepID=A0ABR7CXT8_9BACT|nr:sigma-70 family RNA polymerase sigma factor [Butyricimonas hominis]MBC5620337.1 sigma-70 family RNA polymerase sigma factor [Butyricimonas hominis]